MRTRLLVLLAITVLTTGVGVPWMEARAADAPPPATATRDCPPVTLAQGAAQETASDASKSEPPAPPKLVPRGGRSPVGTPGMFTGIDTGVTRGLALRSMATTGMYGAGSESTGVYSGPDTPAGSGVGPAARAGGSAAKDPCR